MEVSSGKQIRRMKGLTEVETAAIFDYAQEQFNIEASLVLHFYQFVSSQDSLLYFATLSLTIEVNLIKHESHVSSQHVICPHCPKHFHYTIHIIYIPPANPQRLIHLKNVVYARSLARANAGANRQLRVKYSSRRSGAREVREEAEPLITPMISAKTSSMGRPFVSLPGNLGQ